MGGCHHLDARMSFLRIFLAYSVSDLVKESGLSRLHNRLLVLKGAVRIVGQLARPLKIDLTGPRLLLDSMGEKEGVGLSRT